MAGVEPLKIIESAMFGHRDSIEELQDYLTQYAGKEHAFIAELSITLTVNTIVHIMDTKCGGKAVAVRAEPLFKKEKVQA
jgi:hypothetical protein